MRVPEMQVANQSGESDQKMSPSIHAALIDSLFTDPGPMFAGALCAAVAAVMTALKTGNALLWPCVALLVVTGALRALDTRQYQKVRSTAFIAGSNSIAPRPKMSRAGKCATSSAPWSMPRPSGCGA